MKKKFQPENHRSVSASKWPQALLLSVGLTGLCLQAQAQPGVALVVRENQDSVLELGDLSDQHIIINPDVVFTITDANVSSTNPVITITKNNALHMEKDSKIIRTVDGDGVMVYGGNVSADGANIEVYGEKSTALSAQGMADVALVNTNLSAQGVDGNALLLSDVVYGWGNSVVVNGGSLVSDQGIAVLLEGDALKLDLKNVNVSGTNAIRVEKGRAQANTADVGDLRTNIINVTDSTLTGTKDAALYLGSSSSIATLRNTKVNSKYGRISAIVVNGKGNHLDMEGGESGGVEVHGLGDLPVAGLVVAGGSAEVRRTSIDATGDKAGGVLASSANVHLNEVAISTSGIESVGIAANNNQGNGILSVSGGSIATKGAFSNGVNISLGAMAKVTGTRIDIAGDGSNGVAVHGDSEMEIRNSTINMSNRTSDGAAYVTSGTGAQLKAINVNANVVGTVTGLNAAGGTARISGGSITTEDGVGMAISDGADVMISDGAHLNTTGAAAHAVHLSGRTRTNVTVDGATVATQHGQADIFRGDGAIADVTIQNGATIDTDGNLLNLKSKSGLRSEVNLAVDNAEVRGNIVADSTSTGNVTLRNGAALTSQVDSAALTIDSSSKWNASGNSQLTSLTLNGGMVNFGQPVDGTFKTIKTASLDGNGGRILMHATLGDGSDQADLLHMTGDASGTHVLDVRNAGGAGAQTDGDGIHLVQADGRSNADNFTLAGGVVQAGMYEYFLKQGGQSRASDWYLRSTHRAALPAYIMTPTLNRDYGYSTVGTLHERVGDLGNIVRGEKDEGSSDGVWGRIGGAQLRTGSSDQIDANASSSFMQFGKDWTLDADATGASTHAGATMTLGEMRASFSDEKRIGSGSPVGRDTGTAKTRAVGVGGYWTRYFTDGAYLDAVGQLTRYGTTFKDAHALEASGKGTGVALSIEAGKPFASYGSLRMEAQGQMIYQYMRADKFNDGVAEIDANSSHAMRGRVGVRVFQEMQNGDIPRPAAPYAIFNVWRNFSGAASVGIDGQSLQTQTNKTWGEIGVGITGRLSKQGMLQASLKYRHQLGGLQFEGTAGEIGYRYSW